MQNIQSMKQSVQKGFTLIELMIVVAIIGILAALAIPAYTDYTIKSRVGEGASLSGQFKTATEVYWSENGTLTGIVAGLNASTLGTSAAEGEYVSSILFLAGPVIDIQYKTTTKLGAAAGSGGANSGCIAYVPVRPATTGGNLIWSVNNTGCTGSGVATKYVPRT